MPNAPWSGSFEVEGDSSGGIHLEQIDDKHFELHSTVCYVGKLTGLEDYLSDEALAEIRFVTPERLPTTDLTSVPGVLRWFASRYGIHTPASLIHDWLIPQPSTPAVAGMTDQYADRYFRFMLEDLGVPLIRRWLMWAAVAARSRWQQGLLQKVLLSLWIVASVAGMAAFVYGLTTGNVAIVAAATLAPLVFALLWERQYGAGIVAAYSAPWILPPTIFALAGYGVYLILEFIVGVITRSRSKA
jgi:hypothetical protein